MKRQKRVLSVSKIREGSPQISFVLDLTRSFVLASPYPGSRLFEKLKKEGRLLYGDSWEKYDRHKVCFKPKQMTVDELQEGYNETIRKVFNYGSIKSRLENLLKMGFYNDLYLKKRNPNFILRKGMELFTAISPLFIKDEKTRQFFKSCNRLDIKPNPETLWISYLYYNSYKEILKETKGQ